MEGRDVKFSILISHSWTTADHPDPDESQLHALKTLVYTLADIGLVLLASPGEQHNVVPTLNAHGVLQAAVLASRFVCPHAVLPDHDHVLRLVGVWYDYVCMPQKPRTKTEQYRFKASLRNPPNLFSAAPVISLRENANGGCMSRGWCLA